MYKSRIVYTLLFIFGCANLLHAQEPAAAATAAVSGIVKDNVNEPQIGATVSLQTPAGAYAGGGAADIDGHFVISNISPGTYRVKISYLGFTDYTKEISVGATEFNLGIVKMEPSKATALKEVDIVEKAIAVQQKDDTTQFNANSYKVNPDASAEDLVRKMPGIDLSSGTPQAQGEQVAKVLVDGKPFFGDDATSSLKNLPAEVIDKIQVYDEKSEQSQFTGFDDGNTSKVINIVTKPGKRQGVFGKVYGAYGYDDKYNAGGNINYFQGDRRISLIGQTNNVNIQNFAAQDLLGISGGSGGRGFGGGGRRGGDGGGGMAGNNFMTAQQGGISKTNAVGFNYSDKWGKKVDVTASYFFNNSNNVQDQQTNRQYLLPSQADQTYDELSNATTNNYNHRFNMRLNYTIDSSNSLLFIPTISAQNNNSNSTLDGKTYAGSDVINSITNNFNSKLKGYNLNGMLLYRHKFKKRGRTLSLMANGGYNDNEGNTKLYSNTIYDTSLVITDQEAIQQQNGWTLNSNINYTEPLSRKSFMQVQYGLRYQESESDKRTYNFSQQTGDYTLPDTLLSNTFTTDYLTHRGGLTYRYMDTAFNFNIGVDFQYATLNNDRVLPYTNNLQRSFNNILPSARFQYNFDKKKNLRLFYRTSTNAPSVTQLQDVINNANLLQQSVGNPDLVQSYQHNLMARYNATNTARSSTFFAMLSGSLTQNYIANSTIIAEDTMTVNHVFLERGAQLSKPVNLDGYVNLRSFATYGMPVAALKSNLNINASAGYVRIPGLINDRKNYANNTNLGLGLVLSSNISEKVDFTISSNSSYNIVTNTLNTTANNKYFNQSSRLSLNYIFWRGIVFNTELNHQLYTGLSAGYNQNFLLWNMSVAKKVFKNQQGEIKLSVFDLLKQNNSIARSVTETYTQDLRTNVLQRYFMLTFTYNLRFFKGGASMKDAERNSDRGMMDRGMMPPPGMAPGMGGDYGPPPGR
ncbi:outer membrane beta-barrel protein [Taibaiella chishuiensis]|uniref:Carboxypeptidase family protein n=1 Tax=Taibaiella chishuiensis TaxID=1434707 RepID=A0A2P8DCL5_9BACT|nr:outer membrane beta-barrel protein [Taibaiella chishuiensis]PSK94963.1 carboxypeptidase family protein [Taibaiella chishuiensis]